MSSIPIRAAVRREFGQLLSIENLYLAAPNSGQVCGEPRHPLRAIARFSAPTKHGTSVCQAVLGHAAAGVTNAVGKNEFIARTYTIDEMNEAIDTVKNGQAIRNVLGFDRESTVG